MVENETPPSPLTRKQLLDRLRRLSQPCYADAEPVLVTAAQLLLDFINDPAITRTFNRIGQRYS